VITASFPGGEVKTIRGTVTGINSGGILDILIPKIDQSFTKGTRVQIDVHTGAVSKSFKGVIVFTQGNHIFLKPEISHEEKTSLRILWIFEVLVEYSDEMNRKQRIKARTRIFGADSMSIIVRKDAATFREGDHVKIYAKPYEELIEISGTVVDIMEVDLLNKEYWIKYDALPEKTMSKIYRNIFRRQIEIRMKVSNPEMILRPTDDHRS
jgi:hypothetical protein